MYNKYYEEKIINDVQKISNEDKNKRNFSIAILRCNRLWQQIDQWWLKLNLKILSIMFWDDYLWKLYMTVSLWSYSMYQNLPGSYENEDTDRDIVSNHYYVTFNDDLIWFSNFVHYFHISVSIDRITWIQIWISFCTNKRWVHFTACSFDKSVHKWYKKKTIKTNITTAWISMYWIIVANCCKWNIGSLWKLYRVHCRFGRSSDCNQWYERSGQFTRFCIGIKKFWCLVIIGFRIFDSLLLKIFIKGWLIIVAVFIHPIIQD